MDIRDIWGVYPHVEDKIHTIVYVLLFLMFDLRQNENYLYDRIENGV